MAINLITRKRPMWVSIVIIVAAFLLIVAAAAIWMWNIWIAHAQTPWIDLMAALIAVLGVIFAFVPLLPMILPSRGAVSSSIPVVSKLDRSDLNMGTVENAYFPYVNKPKPIMTQYEAALQTLRGAKLRKQEGIYGLFVTGETNAGKTRLVVEALNAEMPDWYVILLPSRGDVEIPNRGNIVVFIDALQEYASPVVSGSEVAPRKSDGDLADLKATLNKIRATARRCVVVVTSRSEDEERVRQAKFGWLIDNLKPVILDIRNATPEEVTGILDEFKQKGAEYIDEFDGTLGSLVLGFKKKRTQYFENLAKPAQTVLQAM